ncbi:MAG: hypothetical protein CMQ17_04100 [Gammaproteobacteria bacterium]|jgi:hypothetical protein|nr:hypothetical protein [Gammaproteobacteria bacterium]|tara:strand:- start:69 stop:323 length:255 start_codon:yes stop_codon:yes gene_type:complete
MNSSQSKRLFVCLILLFLNSSSHAYLDPGTGSLILQGVIAGIAMVSLTLKMYWFRFKAFFSKKDPEAENQEAVKAAAEEPSEGH